ncbi:collagen alpha-1(VII) chain [Lissotriton helveticus]
MKAWIPLLVVLYSVVFSPEGAAGQRRTCSNVYSSDVVFVVDGSSSIGRANFVMIKQFMEGLVVPFVNVVSEDGVRFGVVQYSDDPRTEFTFTQYRNGTQVMQAIRNIPYKGGNTRTGTGLRYAADNFFGPNVIRRDVPKVAILITDGKSQDDVDQAAQKLKSQGIKVFAVGIKNADSQELNRVASTPSDDYFFYVTDFKILGTLLPLVSRRVCTSTGGVLETEGSTYKGPTNLVISEPTTESLRIRWTAASGPLTGYKVQYVPLTAVGQQITAERQELNVRAGETTAVLRGLRAGTEYAITVIAQYANSIGESVSGSGRTGSQAGVLNFRVVEAGPTSLRLAWAVGAEPPLTYRITYTARGDAQTEEKSLVGSAVSDTLSDLLPNTEYVITLYPQLLRQTGAPSSITGRTLRLEAVQGLAAQNITSQSAVMSWRGVSGATGYRISWRLLSGQGEQDDEVEGDQSSYLIQRLLPNTVYRVTVTPLYGSSEGRGASAEIRTDSGIVQTLRTFIVGPTTIRVNWNIIPEARGYRLEWRRATGSKTPQTVQMSTDTDTYEITGLRPGTEYRITLYTLYDGREVATPATTSPTVGSVSNLRVTETEGKTIRLAWTGVVGATQYKIVIRSADGTYERTRMIPGTQNTIEINDLSEDITYTLRVSALAGRSEGIAVPLTVRIEPAPIGTVTNLRVLDMRGGRIRLSWNGVAGATEYLIVVRNTVDGTEVTSRVRGDQNIFDLQDLKEGVPYNVRMTTLVGTREGPAVTITVRTEDVSVPVVSNLRVSEAEANRVRVVWTGVARATGYKIIWRHSDGREFSRLLPAEPTSFYVDGLEANTVYTIAVSAQIGSRESAPVTLTARTGDVTVGRVTNLRVTGSEDTKIRIAWSAVPRATGYKVTWRRSDGIEVSRTVAGDILSAEITELEPETAYTIRVVALVGSREGSPTSISARTGFEEVGIVSRLRIFESNTNRIRVTWIGIPGATSYRIMWSRTDGIGTEGTREVPGDTTSFDLVDLDGGVNYTVKVIAVIRNQEGDPVSINVKTPEITPVSSVGNLRIIESAGQRIRISWTPVAGSSGYRVSWRLAEGGSEITREIGGDASSYEISSLQPGGRYVIRITTLLGDRESEPVSITATTAQLPPVTNLRVTEVQKDAVTLTWNPVPGAVNYILSWKLPTDIVARDLPPDVVEISEHSWLLISVHPHPVSCPLLWLLS